MIGTVKKASFTSLVIGFFLDEWTRKRIFAAKTGMA